jgi:phage protein U
MDYSVYLDSKSIEETAEEIRRADEAKFEAEWEKTWKPNKPSGPAQILGEDWDLYFKKKLAKSQVGPRPELGSFGPGLVFEINSDHIRTYSNFRRTSKIELAHHEIFGDRPKLEWLGAGLDEVELSIRLDTNGDRLPEIELENLRSILFSGKPELLVIAGDLLGTYLLESLTEERMVADRSGKILVADLKLKFKEYR